MNFLTCMNQLFHSYDYHQNVISHEEFIKHNTPENPWISFENKVFSIQKDDQFLLHLFKEYYGKDVSAFVKTMNHQSQLDLQQRLQNRCIGILNNLV